MYMKILGIEEVDYVSKKTGKPVKGKKLHMCYKSDKVVGYSVVSEYVPDSVGYNFQQGEQIKLLYNKFGQVEEVLAQ